MRAEVIAIGDELVSGQRLDTNSQWISARLAEIGIEPQFHSTVGDDLDSGLRLFRAAAERSDIVISTGGIGPTRDDLTRHVIAEAAGVSLEFNDAVEQHIQAIFASYGREMPENNRIQAFFPAGSQVIPNSEGTAPGIDKRIGNCRFFALPGVPYEMKEMWEHYVATRILQQSGQKVAIRHHSVHCFGAGESQIELMLDGMTERNHYPRIGITASHSTISLRITSIAESEDRCDGIIQQTTQRISDKLGDLVFGSNGQTLADVVNAQLATLQKTISIVDCGFGGAVAHELSRAEHSEHVLKTCFTLPPTAYGTTKQLIETQLQNESDVVLTIGPISEKSTGKPVFEAGIHLADQSETEQISHVGHSGLRESRTVKAILNLLRLRLPPLLQTN